MKRLKSWFMLCLVFTATHAPLLATAKHTLSSDFDPLEMYETIKSGAWRHLNPREIKPEQIAYSAGSNGITAYITHPLLSDDTPTHQKQALCVPADFMYQLALLPTLVNYCLDHALDDSFLDVKLPPQAIDDFFDSAKSEIPAHSYHFIHNVLGKSARFDFFKELMPEDFLDESSWGRLSSMVTHIEQKSGLRTPNFPVDRDYFAGKQFIADLGQGVLEIMQCAKPGDHFIGVGNTPQLPLRVLSNLVPAMAPTVFPLSGWPGRHKLGTSWIDNVMTPRALFNMDARIRSLLGPDEAHLPVRLVFVDIVANGFGIDVLINRIHHVCQENGWKAPLYHVISLADCSDNYTKNVIFEGNITQLTNPRLGTSLDDMDELGRYLPSSPARVWDAGIPSIGKPDDVLEPLLHTIDTAFRKMTL